MSIEKNIVAIGGGGFGRTVKDLRIEEYILSLSNKEINTKLTNWHSSQTNEVPLTPKMKND